MSENPASNPPREPHEPDGARAPRGPHEPRSQGETFAETLTGIATAGRDRMRPFPVASVQALSRRRRQRTAVTATVAAAATCAVAVTVVFAAGNGTGSAPVLPGRTSPLPARTESTTTPSPSPSTSAATTATAGSTSTSVPSSPSTSVSSSPSTSVSSASGTSAVSIPAMFLAPNELPGASTFQWSPQYFTPDHLEEPLPSTCGISLGTNVSSGVYEVRYKSTTGPESIDEHLFLFATPDEASAALARMTPQCGTAGFTTRSADGFGWAEKHGSTIYHLVAAKRDLALVTLEGSSGPDSRPYDSSTDGTVLATMAARLSHLLTIEAMFPNPGQIPYADGQPWRSTGAPSIGSSAQGAPGTDNRELTDLCQSSSPADPSSNFPLPEDSLEWLSGNSAIFPAGETIRFFDTTDAARAAYQKARNELAARTCHITVNPFGDAIRTIGSGVTVANGFSINASDTYATTQSTGNNDFHMYVVLKGKALAILIVPTTKDQAKVTSSDANTLNAVYAHLP
ncbi:MAG: hypothetical protein ACJ786_34840 [Catenulispora sp.]